MYLYQDLEPSLNKIEADSQPLWGEMTAHQMIEHLGMLYAMAMGKLHAPLITPPEKWEEAKNYFFGQEEMERGVAMKFDLPPLRTANIEEAKLALEKTIDRFIAHYKNQPNKTEIQPMLGPLNFEEWKIFLSKHNRYHLKQFGLID